MTDDRIKEFRIYLENMNMNLFDQKVAEVTEWITDNSITRIAHREIKKYITYDDRRERSF